MCYRIAIIASAVAAVWVLLLADSSASDALRTEQPPNIVMILADDVGREVLGCYGGTSYRTPHLDALAAGGIRFQHCYSMPVCHPTRICLLTGRYPLRVGNPRWGSFPVSLQNDTLPHVLKRAGYVTAISGKWQLALLKENPRHPHELGFDQYCLFGWHEGPRYYRPLIWRNGQRREELAERYGPDVYCDFLIDFMRENSQRPFFALYSMAFCHDVTDDLEEPVPLGPKGRYDNYQEMAEGMDQRVGRIVAALDQLGLRQRTLVLYTADNGTPAGYIATARDGRLTREPIVMRVGSREVTGGKGQLTDAGTRVPTIANWPGIITPGQVVDDLIDFSDFLPTLAELAGATLPAGVPLDGHSFARRLRQGQAAPRRWALAQGRDRFFVRTQQYKLYSDGRLYDALRDPNEEAPIETGSTSSAAEATRRELQIVVNRFAND